MNEKQAGIFRWVLILLASACLLFGALQLVTVYTYNQTVRTVEGASDTEPVSAGIQARGTDTSSWIKQEARLQGAIYDITLHNKSNMQLSTWTLQLNIQEDCLLNQFWNGEVEIHQHVASGSEKIQRLNLAKYEKDLLTLDYRMDASDLLIPLSAGDYVVYYPSASIGEIPVRAGEETVVGLIMYQNQGASLDLSDYSVSFTYRRLVTQGSLFIFFIIAAAALLLMAGHYYSSQLAYRRARKEMDNRVSGISCMTELFTLIYIIDLAHDAIFPVGVDEKADAARPKDKSAREQILNLFRTDAKPGYADMMQTFADMDTVPRRLMERRHIVQEYESKYYGWCRIYFIDMDNIPGKEPQRILFTVQQINQEKKEIQSIMMQVEKARSEKGESRKFVESISAGIQAPLRSILARSDMIREKSSEEAIRSSAEEIMQTSEVVLSMVDNTLDLVRLNADTMKLARVPYSFRHLMQRVENYFRISIMGNQLEFRMEISPEIPDVLIGDGPKLRQVLLNLLGRSMSALASGSITLRVFARRLEGNRIHMLFSVLEKGRMTGLEDAGQSLELLEGLLALMGSSAKSAHTEGGRDCYFEIEQGISPDQEKAPGEPDMKA